MRSTPRRAALVGVAVAACLLSACVPPPDAVTAPPPPRAVVYGDSLVAESRLVVRERLEAALPGWQVTVRAFPGTAQCDWHRQMLDDAAQLDPGVVVVAFSGNRLTDCILERDGIERAFPDAYGEDAAWAAELWAAQGTPLAFVGAPPPAGTASTDVAELYRDVAAASGTPFVAADRLFVDPATGLAQERLGCLPGEDASRGCTDGSIRVRHLDGRHLCTVPILLQACPAYASGVTRYADVLTEAAAAALGTEVALLPDATSPPSG